MTLRVLIVDDEEDMEALFRQGLRRELRAGKVEIAFAVSVDDALGMIADDRIEPFDKVISDLNMPGKSGLEFLTRMGESNLSLEMAVVSANADFDTRAKVESLGASAFFSKPIDFREVRTFVTAC